MKTLLIAGAMALALPGCEAVRTLAPQTVAGFEANGVLGALDGASGAVVARCQTLDGVVLRVAVDEAAALTGTGDALAKVRAARMTACAAAGAVAMIVDGAADVPVPVARPGG